MLSRQPLQQTTNARWLDGPWNMPKVYRIFRFLFAIKGRAPLAKELLARPFRVKKYLAQHPSRKTFSPVLLHLRDPHRYGCDASNHFSLKWNSQLPHLAPRLRKGDKEELFFFQFAP